MTKIFTPSKYNKAVFEKVEQGGSKAYVIAAVPGSGKTEQVAQSMPYISTGRTVLCTAFNVSAAENLQSRTSMFPGHDVTCLNIHKVGTETLKANHIYFRKESGKYNKIAKRYFENRHLDPREFSTTIDDIVTLVEKVRLTLTNENDVDALDDLIERFDIEVDRDEDYDRWHHLVHAIPFCIEEGIRQATSRGEGFKVDFTDMIWIPVRLKLEAFKKFDYLFLDEAQDFSPCQRELLLSCAKPSSTIFCLGDRNQAIYGWAGASLYSIDELIGKLHAEELELSICYRCPKRVVRLAASVFPGIEYAEDAEEGEVEYVQMSSIPSIAKEGDLILGRWNAPLVSMCLDLLLDGKRANVRGKELGKTVATFLAKIQKKLKGPTAATFLELPNYVERYRSIETRKLEADEDKKEENQEKIDKLLDKVKMLLLLFNAYRTCFDDEFKLIEDAAYTKYTRPTIKDKKTGKILGYGEYPTYPNLENFLATVENFFEDDPTAQIVLSTIHKAKGQQNPRVIILDYDTLPSKKPTKRTKNIKEEQNLEYVAITRAQKTLLLAVAVLPVNPIYTGLPVSLDEQEVVEEAVAILKESATEEQTKGVRKDGKPRQRAAGGGRKTKDKKRLKKQYVMDPQVINDIERGEEIDFEKCKTQSQLLEKIILASPVYQALVSRLRGPQPPDNGPEEKSGQQDETKPEEMELESTQETQIVAAPIEEPTTDSDIVTIPLFDEEHQGAGRTVRMMFVCKTKYPKPCKNRWSIDYYEKDRKLYREENGQQISFEEDRKRGCSMCHKTYFSAKTLKAKYNHSVKCTSSCKNATSHECECVCGGVQHGKNKLIGVALYQSKKQDEHEGKS